MFFVLLLVVFQIKHFLADYPLQNSYMLGKFKRGWDFLIPLVSHCLVHASLTLLIISSIASLEIAFCLAFLDFVVHFVMDKIKADHRLLGRFKPDQAKFWYSLGLDQMVHHLTHYFIIYYVVVKG